MSDYDHLGYRSNIVTRMRAAQAGLKMRQVDNTKALTSSEISADAGSQSGDEMTLNTIHARADAVDINWWLPIGISDDLITEIDCLKLRTIGGVKYLYAGGIFTRIGGVSAVNIARYNFTSRAWEAIDDGSLNAVVRALDFKSDDTLIIGGDFTNASGVAAADYVAQLSAGVWIAVGGGVNNVVRAVAFDTADSLFIGGDFTDAGGVAAADYIAKLYAGAWTSVYGGVNGKVYCIVFDIFLDMWIGGDFTDAGGDATGDRLAHVEGAAWGGYGTGGINGTVRTVSKYLDGNLFVGGDFTDANGDADADNLFIGLPGEQIADLGQTPGLGTVRAIVQDDVGNLYIAGLFASVAGLPNTNYIAKWDGQTWKTLANAPLAGGTGVFALAVDPNGTVYAGGNFLTAGALQCKGITVATKLLSDGLDMVASLFEQYQARGDAKYKNNAVLVGNGNGATVAAGVTVFAGPGSSTLEAAEANVAVNPQVGGVVRTIWVRTSSAQPGTGSLVITLRDALVDTTMVLTIPAGSAAGNYAVITNPYTLTAHNISLGIKNNAATASAAIRGFAIAIQPS